MFDADQLVFSVSDFVAVLNQTLDYAYPDTAIIGEISNFRISKNRWVYFDLKDEHSSVKCFGTVHMLPGPLEDGLVVQVSGSPRLHQQFGFSVNLRSVQPVGEGSLKKAAVLLEKKLALEGMFDGSRKRGLPYPPSRIGLVASSESAAYHDFMKILNARWGGVAVQLADVQVQGEPAPRQIVAAVEYFNTHADPVDILVVTRGGGSADDLAAFSTEQVTRAIAGSRIPTLVAIGHEVDTSLAELAADQRASTPSNAAEMLVPDKNHQLALLYDVQQNMLRLIEQGVTRTQERITDAAGLLHDRAQQFVGTLRQKLDHQTAFLEALSPHAALKRGYAIVRSEQGSIVRTGRGVKVGDMLDIRLSDTVITAEVKKLG